LHAVISNARLASVAATLIVTMSAFNVSPSAASGEEAQAPGRHLLYNGQPLTKLLLPADVSQNAFVAGERRQPGAQISGVAFDRAGQRLGNQTVTLQTARRPVIVATTTTDPEGRFRFSGLSRGQYVIEVLSGTEMLATSNIFRVAEGGMTFVQVGGAAVSSSHHRKGILYWTAVGAGIGGGIGFLTMMRDECRNPDSLCPLAPMMFGMMGAIVGLFAAPGN
jgi:carboxypeptidase family protein